MTIFGVVFGVDFNVFLKCSCCSRGFCFFFLLLVGSDFSFVFPWVSIARPLTNVRFTKARTILGRNPNKLYKHKVQDESGRIWGAKRGVAAPPNHSIFVLDVVFVVFVRAPPQNGPDLFETDKSRPG